MGSNIWTEFKDKLAVAFQLVDQMPLGLQVLAVQHADSYVTQWKQSNIVSTTSGLSGTTFSTTSGETITLMTQGGAGDEGTEHFMIKQEEPDTLEGFVEEETSILQVAAEDGQAAVEVHGAEEEEAVAVMTVVTMDGEHVMTAADSGNIEVQPVDEIEGGNMLVIQDPAELTPEPQIHEPVPQSGGNHQVVHPTPEQVTITEAPPELNVNSLNIPQEGGTGTHLAIKQEAEEGGSGSLSLFPQRRPTRAPKQKPLIVLEGLNLNAADLIRQLPSVPVMVSNKRGRPPKKGLSAHTERASSGKGVRQVNREIVCDGVTWTVSEDIPLGVDEDVQEKNDEDIEQSNPTTSRAQKLSKPDKSKKAEPPALDSPRRSSRKPKASVKLRETEEQKEPTNVQAQTLKQKDSKKQTSEKTEVRKDSSSEEKTKKSATTSRSSQIEQGKSIDGESGSKIADSSKETPRKTKGTKRKIEDAEQTEIKNKSGKKPKAGSDQEKKTESPRGSTSQAGSSLRTPRKMRQTETQGSAEEDLTSPVTLAVSSPPKEVSRRSGRSIKRTQKFENFLGSVKKESLDEPTPTTDTADNETPASADVPKTAHNQDEETAGVDAESPDPLEDAEAESEAAVAAADATDDDLSDADYEPQTNTEEQDFEDNQEDDQDISADSAEGTVIKQEIDADGKEEIEAAAMALLQSVSIKRGRGRPKGSKSKTKDASSTVCTICNAKFPIPSRLKVHLLSHSSEKPLMCELCGRPFKYLAALKHHLKVHLGVKDFACTLCDYKATSKHQALNHVRKVHTQEKPYSCDECGMRFHSKKAQWGHRTVHQEQTYECDECDFRTSRKNTLITHIKNRHEEQVLSYQCQTCDRKFKHRESFTVHQRLHTGERPFACRKCGASFPSTSQRAQHERTHEEPRYQCSICQKKFVTKHQLQRHDSTHTGIKKYSCPFCAYKCNCETNLRKHCRHVHKLIYPPIQRQTARRSDIHQGLPHPDLENQEFPTPSPAPAPAPQVSKRTPKRVSRQPLQEEVVEQVVKPDTEVEPRLAGVVTSEAQTLLEHLQSGQVEAVAMPTQTNEEGVQQIIITKDVNEVGEVVLSPEEYDAWDSGTGVIQVIQVVDEGGNEVAQYEL